MFFCCQHGKVIPSPVEDNGRLNSDYPFEMEVVLRRLNFPVSPRDRRDFWSLISAPMVYRCFWASLRPSFTPVFINRSAAKLDSISFSLQPVVKHAASIVAYISYQHIPTNCSLHSPFQLHI